MRWWLVGSADSRLSNWAKKADLGDGRPLVGVMAATGARSRGPVAVAARIQGLSTREGYKWRRDAVLLREGDDDWVINALWRFK